ncbi:ras-related protein Rab-31 [Carlito syrichta]|uniref:Ras-related protein Rab-31 n=1 Tax=Carlito syrichta TaxID=1868482 RepID=A0A3Q0DUA9_CARSF|nr:ras-related protein Rab-31 [Carlito syrichta]
MILLACPSSYRVLSAGSIPLYALTDMPSRLVVLTLPAFFLCVTVSVRLRQEKAAPALTPSVCSKPWAGSASGGRPRNSSRPWRPKSGICTLQTNASFGAVFWGSESVQAVLPGRQDLLEKDFLMSIASQVPCCPLNTGDTGVGKSSIVCRFVQDHFDHNISPTIGASFMTKTVPCGNELHKFLIWDTAGQERFHSLAPMYYRGSAAAVIVYDITKQDSFHTLKKWVKELKEHGPENIVMAIAGNKCDLSDIREVPLKDAKEYAESIGAIVVETSAKNAINIEELFQGISRQIPPLDPHENGNNGAIKLVKQPSQASRRCC